MEQPLNRPLLDFSDYIVERTKDFTDWEWVFAEIERRLTNPEELRYFIIIGEPVSPVADPLRQENAKPPGGSPSSI